MALLERAMSRLHALATGSIRDSPDPTTGILPPGLQDTPQEEEGDLMYPPQQHPSLTQPCSSSSGLLPIAGSGTAALLSPPLEDDGDLW